MATSEYTQSKSINVDNPALVKFSRQNAADKLYAVSAMLGAIQWIVDDDVVKELCDRAGKQIEELEIDITTICGYPKGRSKAARCRWKRIWRRMPVLRRHLRLIQNACWSSPILAQGYMLGSMYSIMPK